MTYGFTVELGANWNAGVRNLAQQITEGAKVQL
jgi:hypothetical protein